MKIGVDLDGVVANFIEEVVFAHNEDFGTELTVDQVSVWDFLHLTKFAAWEEFWEWVQEKDLFFSMSAYPGAIGAIKRLAQEHEVVFVTSRPEWAIDSTNRWLSQRGLKELPNIHTSKKWGEPCDIYIEDGPSFLKGLAKHAPDATIIRVVRPWNKSLKGVVDAGDWQEVETLINEIQTGL